MKRTFLAKLLLILSGLFTAIGFVVMYTYPYCSETDLKWGECGLKGIGHVVGGDAYNYIIMAGRATGWMVAGLTAAVVGGGIQVYDKLVEIGHQLPGLPPSQSSSSPSADSQEEKPNA